MRILAILAGMILLGSATWAVIEDGQLVGPHALLVAAMAAGTAAGAVVAARTSLRVAVAVFAAVLAGESFGMAMTAERIITHREAQSIETAASTPTGQMAVRRLDEARKAVRTHDAHAITTSAEPHCGRNCRALLESTRERLVAERETAQAAVAAIAGVRSTPLADRLGVEPWQVDLAMAGLLSIGANGLACVLIAWGAHGRREAPTSAPKTLTIDPEPVSKPGDAATVVPMRRRANGRDAGKFAMACIRPGDGAVPLKAVAEAYWSWCDTNDLTRPDMATTVSQLVALFGKVKVETEMTASREVVARGIVLTGKG